MKGKFFTLILTVLSVVSYAQNVGIGTPTPNASAKLDISSTTSGLLIPRVALVNVTNNVTPVSAPATGLLVFNTNVAVTGGNGQGFYYWDGTIWRRIEDNPSDDWTILGNTGTNPATNFLGTTDAQDLVVRTNNTERVRVLGSNGYVGIGTNAPTDRLVVSNGRVEFTNTTDANGTAGSGVLEIGNTLRIDGNEIITDDNTVLYLQNDNNGDLRVDINSLVVDASGNSVGIGITTPNANAVLDVTSTTKGIFIPRMTTAQRDAIAGPAQGLTIYNTDNQCMEWWDISLAGANKWNSYCQYCEHAVYISASQNNLDFYAYLGTQGISRGPFNYCVTINAGVTIGASVAGGNALNFSNMPDGAKIYLVNEGRIIAGGGNGGLGGAEGNTTTCSSSDNDGGNGGNGGNAILTKATVPIYATNSGLIAGGGGGGGGGDPGCCSAGGGGGGGAGMPAGVGGNGRCSQCASGVICTSCTGNSCSSAGTAGAVPVGIANASGGTGGAFVGENSPCGTGINGNNGGNGGSLGANGVTPANLACGGCSDCHVPGTRGLGGKAVSGGSGNQLSNVSGGLSYGTVD